MKERKLNKWDRSKPVEILLVLIGTLSSSRSFSFQRDNNKSERDVWMKNEASWNWLRWNTTPSLSIRDTEARTARKDATLTKSECKKNANYCRYSIDAYIYIYMYIYKSIQLDIIYYQPVGIKSFKLIYPVAQRVIGA